MFKYSAALLFCLCVVLNFAPDREVVAGEAVSAQELFQLDFAEIVKRYGDDTITISGIAAEVGPDRFGLPSVTLSDLPDGAHYVLCVLPYSDYLLMSDIEEGKEITLSGSPRSKTAEGILVVKNCVVVPR